MSSRFFLVSAFALCGLIIGNVAARPQVSLDYATYEGITLSNGINQFLGMRYAASPVGDNRFRLPKPPVHETGVVQATQVCPGLQTLPPQPTNPKSFSTAQFATALIILRSALHQCPFPKTASSSTSTLLPMQPPLQVSLSCSGYKVEPSCSSSTPTTTAPA